jgi:hypothetical protein
MTRTNRTATAPAPRAPHSAPAPIAAPKRSQNRHLSGAASKDNEDVTPLENDPDVLSDKNIINPAHLNTDGQEKPPAVDYEDIAENPGPPVKRYLVVKGGRVQTQPNGLRTTLNEGKEIDELNYDIKLLKSQGVKLDELNATG